MKVQVILEKLKSAISNLEKIAEKNASLPILECVLIKAEKRNLIVRATNLHTGIEVQIPSKVDNEGTLAINGQLFNRVLQSLPGDKNIELDFSENLLNINTKSSEIKLKTQDHSEFPTLPKNESSVVFELPADKLIEGMKSVSYSAASSEIKPEIASVYVYSEEGQLVFVSTDSFRLAEKKIEIENVEDFPGTIIPIKNVREIIRIFSSIEGNLKVNVDNNQISFSNSEIYLTSRTIEGNFPDYKQIVPEDFTTEAVFLKKDIADTFKVIEPFSDSYNQILFSINVDDEKVNLSAKNNDIGESNIEVEGKIDGDNVDIRFNHSYFTESLQSIIGDSLIIRVAESRPIVVEPIHDTSFKYLIMPVTR